MILERKPERMGPHGKLRHRRQDSKMGLKDTKWDYVNLIYATVNRKNWLAALRIATKISVP